MISRNYSEARYKRQKRIRKKIKGSPEKPRLCVFRSNKHIYAQLIEDKNGHTLASASTLSKELKGQLKSTNNIEAAKKVGELIAKLALEKNIQRIVFDRNGYKYHGKVKAIAESAREHGLKF